VSSVTTRPTRVSSRRAPPGFLNMGFFNDKSGNPAYILAEKVRSWVTKSLGATPRESCVERGRREPAARRATRRATRDTSFSLNPRLVDSRAVNVALLFLFFRILGDSGAREEKTRVLRFELTSLSCFLAPDSRA